MFREIYAFPRLPHAFLKIILRDIVLIILHIIIPPTLCCYMYLIIF